MTLPLDGARANEPISDTPQDLLIEKTVILVSVGTLQEYIISNIEQLIQLGFKNIHIITDKKYFEFFSSYDTIKLIDANTLDVNTFDAKIKLKNKRKNKRRIRYRNGFWISTSKRFFLIYEYMKINNIQNVLHLENDVLLYSHMNYGLDEKIYLTMDSKDRCIPGIMYIPNYELLTNLILNYDFTKNDMINLAKFYHTEKHIVETFPIIDNSIDKCIYNENFHEFNSIFDGAAIGQYLGGVDPRNIPGDTTGFINETCIIKYDKYNFEWIKRGEHSFPHIEINKKLIPINNLHIHCKNLAQFRINSPI
tara:strand:+ start:471 stop:1394 length:924 start_codon:yes stop_codon:yes gene_type:complete